MCNGCCRVNVKDLLQYESATEADMQQLQQCNYAIVGAILMPCKQKACG